MSASMDGTGRIADDLYLMAHDDRSGHLLVQPRALGLGVAGALLAELVLGGAIHLGPDGALAAGMGRPADELGHRVAGLIAGEQQLPVRDWLLYLARTAPQDVAGRLEQAGYLASAGRRLPWRAARLVPVDPEWAFAPLLRVRAALDASRPLRDRDAALAGLAVASGLWFRVEQYVTPAGRGLDVAVIQLPYQIRELIAQVRAAVDSAVLAGRA